jgi:methylglutaconyl-CoA hydratase
MSAGTLLVAHDGPVLRVTLNRPAVHNALDGALVEALTACLRDVRPADGTRALLLTGAGPSFCAGADLAWMRTVAGFDAEENRRDALRLADFFGALDGCPVPTVAAVQGAALGGGLGLLACCDVVLAADDARFGFTEARLGLLPAVIAPYVVARIGAGQARGLFVTGERFDAARAERIGLVHHVVPAHELAAATEHRLRDVLRGAPGSASGARTLIAAVTGRSPDDVRAYTADLIARLRASDEGREGIAAFLERRAPRWAAEGDP